jgi:ATP-dependent 26S proteasome regulatory subunit
MPLKNFKIDNYLGLDLDLDEDEHFVEHKRSVAKKSNIKNIFIDSKIKKQKITKESLKNIYWGNTEDIMDYENGFDGYLGAYSESEFFSYRYKKVHGIIPECLILRNVDTEKFVTDLFSNANIPSKSYYKVLHDDRGDIVLNLLFLAIQNEKDDKENMYLYIDSDEISIYYNNKLEKDPNSVLNKIISLAKYYVEPKISKNKIYVVYQDNGGFQKTGFTIKKVKVNLEENYNDGFVDISKEIVDGLNSKDKTNLVILSGAPGVGKTTYIRYLAHKLKKNIIFISPDMVNHITDPSFIPFLIKNSDAVLIIEDGEPAIGKRGTGGRTGAVSNMLNLTDGLLSDCLNISIVVTLNTDEKNIDEALLRKGRLLKSYKFEKLSIEKSKKLLKKIGREDTIVDKPMSLADIYYEKDNNSSEHKIKSVGFGR